MSPEKKTQFHVFNSLTKEKEEFKPIVEGKVGMYVCGVTPYSSSHIGHARVYVVFDVLYRYLRYLGYEVVYVRNFTDLDDKIIAKANELGEDPMKLSARFCQEFLEDMADLQCLVPTHQPKVTDHMDQIKDMIAQIITNGCAYVVDGDVFFSVDSYSGYRALSGTKQQEDNRAAEKRRVKFNEKKRNQADFTLWKAAKSGEPQWDSPWGPGRPGWHIECSAMSSQYLTHTFDIHGGGVDLKFPHHDNELAQSWAACPASKISYWMHNDFINTINGEKMSKSQGTSLPIRQVTDMYHPLALRYFLLGNHYRTPVKHSTLQLDIASDALFYTYQTLLDCEDALSSQEEIPATGKAAGRKEARDCLKKAQDCKSKLHDDFETGLADDLHTTTMLHSSLQDALKCVNLSINCLKKQPEKQLQLSIKESLADIQKEIRKVLDVLGLLSNLSYNEVLQQLKHKALKRADLTEDDILNFIKERTQARNSSSFKESDRIRSDLAAKGISLMDGWEETVWRPCQPVQQEQPAPLENPPASVQKDQSAVSADK